MHIHKPSKIEGIYCQDSTVNTDFWWLTHVTNILFAATRKPAQELLKEEEQKTGNVCLGMLRHTEGPVKNVADLVELLGPDMLLGSVAHPPPEKADFYQSCQFHRGTDTAKVFIAERGKHSLLKLRFLPDEEKENRIRRQDFKEATAAKVRNALHVLEEQTSAAQDHVANTRKRKAEEVEKKQQKLVKYQEDRAALSNSGTPVSCLHI